MAVEAKRKCGFRKVHGLYLCGDGIWLGCDRLPLEVGFCPTCGEGIHFPRSMREINPLKLFGQHRDPKDIGFPWTTLETTCKDPFRPYCHVCFPQADVAYLLGVGREYTPQEFISEAETMGVSKRIPANSVPRKLVIGETWVYLVSRKAVMDPTTENSKHETYKLAIFAAFKPNRLEMPIWESEATPERIAELDKRGITAIPITDGDQDHAPRKKNI